MCHSDPAKTSEQPDTGHPAMGNSPHWSRIREHRGQLARAGKSQRDDDKQHALDIASAI